jgi:hypothetical protein
VGLYGTDMAERTDSGETEEWTELEWRPPDEELDHVLVPVEGEKEVDPRGLEPLAFWLPARRSPS